MSPPRFEQVGGEVVLQRRAEPLSGGGRHGLTELGLPIDTGAMPPGPYVLRLRVDGAPPGGEGERTVPFEVVAPPARQARSSPRIPDLP